MGCKSVEQTVYWNNNHESTENAIFTRQPLICRSNEWSESDGGRVSFYDICEKARFISMHVSHCVHITHTQTERVRQVSDATHLCAPCMPHIHLDY